MIGQHLRSVLRFSGRETRRHFWPWAGIVVGLLVVGTMVFMVPAMVSIFGRMQRFAAEHPEISTVTYGPGHYEIRIEGNHPELMPDLRPIMGGAAVVTLLTVFLLAAAVTRRLHDTGRAGWWGLLPLPLVFAGYAIMPQIVGQMMKNEMPDMGLFGLLFVNNFLYLGFFALLVILLAQPEKPEENRFGPPPSR